jgi:Zn-dependent peptidase ImmA (M78 family)
MGPRTRFVREAARKLLHNCRIIDPPVDLQAVSRHLGLEYEEVDYFPDDVDALIIKLSGRTIAVVNKNFPEYVRRFSLAHELCHHYLHQDRTVLEDRITIDSPPKVGDVAVEHDPFEAEAEIFAGELLVPLPMLKKLFRPGFTAAEVARIFAVSESVASIALISHYTALFK